ncbi:MAG: hypothetical protein MPK62_00050 [Alphaproteobacteria bacterium]|nr:hypothetical protein [Alphaproteobacteria bacterium]
MPAAHFRLVLKHHLFNQLTTIGIQGREGTGKTTLARYIAHWLHTELEKEARSDKYDISVKSELGRGYIVRVLNDEDLFNFEETVASLPAVNRILIFDDMSFLKGKFTTKQSEHMKSVITKIRHTEGNTDVRTIIILNFHYSKGLDKYLRDTHFVFFTSLGREDRDNVVAMMGSKQSDKKAVNRFERIASKMQRGGCKIQEPNKKGKMIGVYYDYRYLRIAMSYDSDRPRLMAYPDFKHAVRPGSCGVCFPVEAGGLDPGEVLEMLGQSFGKRDLGSAMKVQTTKRYGDGYLAGGTARVTEVMRRLERHGLISMDALIAKYYNDNTDVRAISLQKPDTVHLPPEFFKAFENKFGVSIRQKDLDSDKEGADEKTDLEKLV